MSKDTYPSFKNIVDMGKKSKMMYKKISTKDGKLHFTEVTITGALLAWKTNRDILYCPSFRFTGERKTLKKALLHYEFDRADIESMLDNSYTGCNWNDEESTQIISRVYTVPDPNGCTFGDITATYDKKTFKENFELEWVLSSMHKKVKKQIALEKKEQTKESVCAIDNKIASSSGKKITKSQSTKDKEVHSKLIEKFTKCLKESDPDAKLRINNMKRNLRGGVLVTEDNLPHTYNIVNLGDKKVQQQFENKIIFYHYHNRNKCAKEEILPDFYNFLKELFPNISYTVITPVKVKIMSGAGNSKPPTPQPRSPPVCRSTLRGKHLVEQERVCSSKKVPSRSPSPSPSRSPSTSRNSSRASSPATSNPASPSKATTAAVSGKKGKKGKKE
jgi:hypothetical protein